MEINPLIPIGSKIKVEKSKIENDLPNKMLDDLPKIINGEVIDYKMTDGRGIGYVLMTDNKIKLWIFKNELDEQTKREYEIYGSNNSKTLLTNVLTSQINKVDYEINGNRNIKTIVNPTNLISWLIFTLKDIF
tara:strand:+ start:423 stop:821 length:399 start_codon:yes stop_codon:yes gene_type:complete